MSLIRTYSLIAAVFLIAGCQKPSDPNPPPTPPNPQPPNPVPPAQTKYDSTYLLTSINGNFQNGQAFNFEYDSLYNLTKFYRPYSWGYTSPCYVIYKNGKINYIVSEYRDINGFNVKASMVFVYGSNNKATKFYYKRPKSSSVAMDNNSPYFTDLNDGEIFSEYDSLAYSPSNRLEKVYRISSPYTFEPYTIIQFYYGDNSDTTLNKIEEYHFDSNRNQFLYDQLIVTQDAVTTPVKNLLWYFPFVFKITAATGGGGNVMSLPLLFDAPSSYAQLYLPLAGAKFIKNYKVYNNWGSYNYKNSIFNNEYSSDSLTITARSQINSQLYVQYKFKKVKK